MSIDNTARSRKRKKTYNLEEENVRYISNLQQDDPIFQQRSESAVVNLIIQEHRRQRTTAPDKELRNSA